MSGIVGIVNLDGALLDRRFLRQWTESLAFRGPDAQEIWARGPVGFGHALLRTTTESELERQPATLDGNVWISADARVDARAELLQKLKSNGREVLRTASDAELILHAYDVWGEACPQHLLGDFVFAIWDERRQSLFCARDHFGVKPFYYARVDRCFVFSNTLECLRTHPAVSNELNDLAIADFLLFDFNQDLATTTFADIMRLPPAHALTCSDGTLRVKRYWTLPIEGPVEYTRPSDYIEHFRELLRTVVQDRLRNNRVAILMSGGLDSTTVAATAKDCLADGPAPCHLRASTQVYDRLIPDQERYYSGLAAEKLGIPIEYHVADNYALYQRWDEPELHTAEPVHDPFAASSFDQYHQVAGHARVTLTGLGGDPALSTSLSSYFAKLLKGRQFARMAADLAKYLSAEGRFSRLYIRTRLRILFHKVRPPRSFPAWLNPEFSARLNLASRWERTNTAPPPVLAVRPVAYQSVVAPDWPVLFESLDPGTTRIPLESRHPFFDLRILRYLLRLPPLPWCSDKELLRRAMRGILPERVRLRRKEPLIGDPVIAALRRGDARWGNLAAPAELLADYVEWRRVPELSAEDDPVQAWMNLRPFSLNLWLHSQTRSKPEPEEKKLRMAGSAQ